MQSKVYAALALSGTLVLTACSKMGELSADNFTVTPSPMEAVGGKVAVTINGRFPEKYMKKKAVVTVLPVIRYGANATNGQPATFQGEKVQGNDQEISYKLGGNYTLKNNFTYVPAMQQSELYLTFDAKVGNKKVNIPDVKVNNGVIATSTLVQSTAKTSNIELSTDKFQYAIKQTKQAQIKYLINQANIRNSELKSTSITDFLKTLKEIKQDQKGFMLDNIEVSAYASPEGGVKFNTALAQNREKTSKSFVNNQLKKTKLDADVDSKYTAEDWEGFKELVSQSNIQDKDVILRVLSMYSDPEEREKQIRNMSAGFKELADEILPELRRARMTINYNLIGRSDDEIQEQYTADASKLSVEELLYADMSTAKKYLNLASQKQPNSAEVNANQALIAMAEGKYEEANNHLMKATAASNYNEVLGNLQIAAGNYAQAAQSLKGVKTNSAALAQILDKDYASASKTLKQVAHADAMTSYLKAIVAARTNQDSEAINELKQAFAKDATLKSRAAKDLEFVTLFNNSAFQSAVK